MSKVIEKVLKQKDGNEVPYSYKEPETLAEAVSLFGEENSLKMLNYGLSVAERHKATPTSSDVASLIKSDPELRALYEKKLAEKRAEFLKK